MADINVKDQSSKQGSETGSQSLERQRESGISRGRSGAWDPFSLSPADFFSSNPFALMRRISEEMARAFGHSFGRTGGGAGGWYPAVEVREQNGQLQVHAELPGLKPEDVKVEITDD